MTTKNRKRAEQEVSNIITAFKEGWSQQRYEFHVTRLENIFNDLEGMDNRERVKRRRKIFG